MTIGESDGEYNPVRDALRELTYADKKGIDYFNATVVQDKTEEIYAILSRSYVERQLERLVADGIAHKIFGNTGSSKKSKIPLYRYK